MKEQKKTGKLISFFLALVAFLTTFLGLEIFLALKIFLVFIIVILSLALAMWAVTFYAL